MKRHLRVLLIAGLLAGGLALCSPTSEAGIFRRGGPFRGWGYRSAYPAYGYSVYRPYGYGMGGYGMGYRSYGWGYGGFGYPAYSGYGNPAFGVYSAGGYPGYGLGGYGMGRYPAVYGTSLSIGTGPYGGFYMSSYPY
jgi:hypothetical protein